MPKQINEQSFLEETGVMGLNQYAGYIFDEFLTQLRGSRRMATFKEMRWNDSTISGCFFALELLARKAPWKFESSASDPSDDETVDFLNSCLGDMEHTWTDFISDAVSMAPFGFSLNEIVLKYRRGDTGNPATHSGYDDGLIGIRKLAPRSQDSVDRWQFNETGDVMGVHQIAPPDYRPRFIPIEKLLHLKTMSNKGNPEGYAFLRGMYRPWYLKKRIENLEAIGVERDLAGIPVNRIPGEFLTADATAAQKAVAEAYRKMGDNLRNDEQSSIQLPSDRDEHGNRLYEFELLQGVSRRQFATNDIIQRYDVRIAMSMMADFLFVGHGATGSFALSASKTELFALGVGSVLDIIAEGFTRKLVTMLLAMNPTLRPTVPPKLVHGDIEESDLKEFGEYVKALTVAGIELDDEATKAHLRSIAGFPPPAAPTAE